MVSSYNEMMAAEVRLEVLHCLDDSKKLSLSDTVLFLMTAQGLAVVGNYPLYSILVYSSDIIAPTA